MTACSAPPVYWSTGHQRASTWRSTGASRIGRREVAEPVPARVDEGVHRVGLAPGRAAALGAGGVDERRVGLERVLAAAGVVDRVGQPHRQLVERDRHDAVRVAVDDRDRRAPVALAADQPVAEPVVDRGLAAALVLEHGHDRREALVRGLAPNAGPELTSRSLLPCET